MIKAVRSVILADGEIKESEQAIMDDLADLLLIEEIQEQDNDLQDPPDFDEYQKQYVLRMLFVAAWADGSFCDSEQRAINKVTSLIEEEGALVELAHKEAKKTILVSMVINQLDRLVLESQLLEEDIKALSLSENDVRSALESWKEQL